MTDVYGIFWMVFDGGGQRTTATSSSKRSRRSVDYIGGDGGIFVLLLLPSVPQHINVQCRKCEASVSKKV